MILTQLSGASSSSWLGRRLPVQKEDISILSERVVGTKIKGVFVLTVHK